MDRARLVEPPALRATNTGGMPPSITDPHPCAAAVATGAGPRQLLSGTEAIVRLMTEQRERDARAGLRTAGFISGYRGSPLGTLDMALWEAAESLKAHDIHFVPGVNEDLAATALWGSQYVGRFDGARVDGVFGLWYGKGPGVDRSGDALKHGNLAGSSPQGGALVLAGDDHAAKSSTTAHQSEPALIAAGIPVLYPADVGDIVHLGLHGLAMSRASGCWVGLKLVTDVVETSATVDLASVGPAGSTVGSDALASRIQDPPRAAEERLMRAKLPAVLDYAASQGLNRLRLDAPGARRGLLTAGKSYADTRQALELLGLDEAACAALGLRLMKLDLVWPLHPAQIANFAAGLDSILVVEEKRALIEDQLKALLYDLPAGAARPAVLGKRAGAAALGGSAEEWLPTWGDLDPVRLARVLARWLDVPLPEALAEHGATSPAAAPRLPSFCSGCPHSTSTRVPEGSRAMAGIGCHGMATIKQPGVTTTMSQMGGEGAMWIGQAPFTTEPHVFTNMGDGTWFHSGALALRAAVAAKVNITYKILVNGFVSMTGGQPIDGEMSVPKLLGNLQAEGVAKVVLVTDDVAKYRGPRAQSLPGSPAVRDRHELDIVQRELRELPGVTVIVYEQPCATERRRLRKRGQWPDPAVRTFIHPAVCEGCGDCGRASDCLSVEPLETPFGRKRRINQSSCNKDRTCVDGFCPSFVTVHGGSFKGSGPARKAVAIAATAAAAAPPAEVELPLPVFQPLAAPLNLLFAGVGGTGVVTASSVLARAAHLQGLEVSVLDVTGLSQKYGAVQSHLRLAPAGQALPASRIAPGQGDVLIGCDLLVGGEPDTVDRLRAGRATAVVNSSVSPSADFTRNPDWQVDTAAVRGLIDGRCHTSAYAPASAMAEQLLGDAIGANLLLLGMAWQRGWVPVTLDAIEQAIRSQGGAAQNLKAFTLGRRAAHDPAWAAGFDEGKAAPQALAQAQPIQIIPLQPRSLAQWLDLHAQHLQAYGGAALAERHRQRIEALAAAEREAGGSEQIAIAAARGYYKLLAHKDEFEVARLLTDPAFRAGLEAQFDGPVQLHLHLGGGALAKTDPVTGQPVKTELRSWIWPAMRLLARLRGVRGTWLDPWRHGAERRLARDWLQRYEQDLDRITAELAHRPSPQAHAAHSALLRLARVPDRLRGYGHVREQHAVAALAEREAAMQALAAHGQGTLAPNHPTLSAAA
jgi:indolepyruvate ferredoxin oxidoreductase